MKTLRMFWVLFAVALIFAISIFVSSRKLKELQNTKNEKEIVVDAPTPEPSLSPSPEGVQNRGPHVIPGCKVQPEFKNYKGELGKIVNVRDLRAHRVEDFLKKINSFRNQYGLPLPLNVKRDRLEKEAVVYNNCRSTCGGDVNQVMVTNIVDNGFAIMALLKDGTHKKIPLHQPGLDLASVDELNKQGIPFRSWLVPISESDWYIKGSELYYSLDIEGVWLKIDTKYHWEVVARPEGLDKLAPVSEPLKINGCHEEEQCLESHGRHFKAPKLCGAS